MDSILRVEKGQWWENIECLINCKSIVCIGVSNPPKKHHPPLSCQDPPFKFANCPSPPFQAITLSILVFREPPIKVRFFSELPKIL